MHWGSLLAGRPLPSPEHVPLEDPLPVVRWMRATLSTGSRSRTDRGIAERVEAPLARDALEGVNTAL